MKERRKIMGRGECGPFRAVISNGRLGVKPTIFYFLLPPSSLVTSTTKTHPPTEHSIVRFYYLTTFPE